MPRTSVSAVSRTGRLLLIGFCVLALVPLITPVRAPVGSEDFKPVAESVAGDAWADATVHRLP